MSLFLFYFSLGAITTLLAMAVSQSLPWMVNDLSASLFDTPPRMLPNLEIANNAEPIDMSDSAVPTPCGVLSVLNGKRDPTPLGLFDTVSELLSPTTERVSSKRIKISPSPANPLHTPLDRPLGAPTSSPDTTTFAFDKNLIHNPFCLLPNNPFVGATTSTPDDNPANADDGCFPEDDLGRTESRMPFESSQSMEQDFPAVPPNSPASPVKTPGSAAAPKHCAPSDEILCDWDGFPHTEWMINLTTGDRVRISGSISATLEKLEEDGTIWLFSLCRAICEFQELTQIRHSTSSRPLIPQLQAAHYYDVLVDAISMFITGADFEYLSVFYPETTDALAEAYWQRLENGPVSMDDDRIHVD